MLSPVDIRENLREWVGAHLSAGTQDVLIDELGFVNRQEGRTVDLTFRADLALANGRLVAFEIKSGADNLKRWPGQCEAYFNVFDEIWLCTHGRHLEKALAVTPKSVGILLADDLGGMALLRQAMPNKRINSFDLSGLLWRDELEELCRINDVEFKSRETKSDLREKVSRAVSREDLRDYVLARLKVRRAD
ncbi:sce7726 family protein [Pseudomonas sp. RC3H12]|uniref:sce7726 family protein n=1 Tax=Pseudomonas sp. RC3H12 TaxID=2834406 RepID=UPI001BDE6CD9|nr:sce7726 family protein [Pseudomonas sp. RC3H12]QWA30471.1 sce7726 family protein [Pseudomonas sp. RC3H12]